MTRSGLLDIVEAHKCQLIARIWMKEPGRNMSPNGSYCYAVQDMSPHFNQLLSAQDERGVLLANGHSGRRRGGLVVSDRLGRRPGSLLFEP